jgi:hypothetical protein
LRTKHPEIRIILRGSELEVVTNSRVKEEAMLARRGDKDFIVPVIGSWSHKMTWKQKGRTILLEGFGENFIQDLKQFATFSKLSIEFGEFPDETGKLSSSIYRQGHIFISEWPQFVMKNACSTRFIFNKNLEPIDEEQHKLAIKERIKKKSIVHAEVMKERSRHNTRTRDDMKEEEGNENMPWFDRINKGFGEFCMYSAMLNDIKEQKAVHREVTNREEDESKRKSKLELAVGMERAIGMERGKELEFKNKIEALDRNYKERMKVEIERNKKESSGKEQKGAWGGVVEKVDQHIYEKPMYETLDYEEDDFDERPSRQRRGFQSGNREENSFEDFDEFRERNQFSSLQLGHKRYQEKHKEKVAVDSIKESISSATNRMTRDLEQGLQIFNDRETGKSTSDEDEDDEVPDERESRQKDILNRREWSPAKNKLINMLAKGKEDSQKDGTDKRRQENEERMVMKAKFIDQLSELEETHAGYTSALEQLELEEDPEDGDNDILDLTAHLSRVGPDLLEGSYATRAEIMRTLANKSGAIIQKKSRRLQGLKPEIRDLLKINNPNERRRLMLEADIEKGNVSPNPKEMEDEREEYGS